MDRRNFPTADEHLKLFVDNLSTKKPFSFIRFSDGEIEILKNRYLEIDNGKTVFRGRSFRNDFPKFDSKRFDPLIHQNIRKDLLAAATFNQEEFFKGIPTAHNNAVIDREFMLRLNGGYTHQMTFSDLFLNSNYQNYRDYVVPLFGEFENIYVISNYRSKLTGVLTQAKHISIPDNFFESYDDVLEEVMSKLQNIESGSIIISSASSLSNVVAHRIALEKSDITFIDVGTSLNDILGLQSNTREYHQQNASLFKKIKYKLTKRSKLSW